MAVPGLHDIVNRYRPCDVFNMDETGLFFRMSADTTIGTVEAFASKKEKSRITVAFAYNADGSCKLEPLFLGTAKKTRCFLRRSADQQERDYFQVCCPLFLLRFLIVFYVRTGFGLDESRLE